jgi:hypothetical protein
MRTKWFEDIFGSDDDFKVINPAMPNLKKTDAVQPKQEDPGMFNNVYTTKTMVPSKGEVYVRTKFDEEKQKVLIQIGTYEEGIICQVASSPSEAVKLGESIVAVAKAHLT